MESKRILHIAVFILSFMFFAAVFSWHIVKYNEYYKQRHHNYTKAMNYIQVNCRDVTLMHAMDTDEECSNRIKMTEEDPYLYALADVLEHWWPCGKMGCERFILSIAGRMFYLLIALFMIVVIFFVAWGFYLKMNHNMGYTVDLNSGDSGYRGLPYVQDIRKKVA